MISSSVVALAACGPTVPVDQGGTTSGASGDHGNDSSDVDGKPDPTLPGTTTPGTATTPTTGPMTITTTVDDGPSTTIDDSADSISFFDAADDAGSVTVECDVWAQDCPEGEKCLPWANDGGHSWNATKCGPLDPDAHAPGEPCTVEGSGFSGIDDCALGAMCWGIDDATNMGTCYAQCGGSEAIPACADGRVCFIGYEGTVTLCVSTCDPLAPECAPNEACVFDATTDSARCIPTLLVSGIGYAEPCEPAVFECGTGLVCVHQDHVPSCLDECCTIACDITAPLECPDVASGQTCLPLYSDGQAPPGLENLGFCGMPA